MDYNITCCFSDGNRTESAVTEMRCHTDDCGDEVELKFGERQLTTASSPLSNNKRNHSDDGEGCGPHWKKNWVWNGYHY